MQDPLEMKENPKVRLSHIHIYPEFLQNIPVAIYTTDDKGILTFYNKKAAEIWGRSPRLFDPEETPFSGSWQLFEPDGTPMPHDQCPVAKGLRNRQGYHNRKIRIGKPDGSSISAEVNVDPVFDENGDLAGAVNIIYDISEKEKHEIDIKRLAAIIESSDDAIISKTLEGIITSWNQAAEKMFGYTEAEVLGKSVTVIIPPSRLEEEDMVLGKIRNGEKIDHFETVRLTKDKRPVFISLCVSPIKNDEGKIIGASKICRDMGKIVEAQQQLAEYARDLRLQNEYKEKFISIASHELKTPLTNIQAYLQLLQGNIQEEPNLKYLNKALQYVGKLTSLVTDLLDITKIEAGVLPLNYSDFKIEDVLSEGIETIRHTHANYEIIREGGVGNLTVRADRLRIEQVIINLLSNAIKYSPNADRVIVNSRSRGGQVTISVKDFGIGIPAAQSGKIFTRFFRVKRSVDHFSGLGIGLYICKEIVERHKGKIWMESEMDAGSVFYFSIPFDTEQE